MKKYIYAILALSITGAVLSGVLLIQHFFPETDLWILSCTAGTDNPCAAVGISDYSTLLGLPIASYGILSYLIYVFTVLIADYAEGKYYGRAIAILFPLSIISLMVDLILIMILVIIDKFCFLCFLTYIINSFLMITIIFWYREYVLKNNLKPSSIYTDFFVIDDYQDRRAAFSSYFLFIFFLSFAVLSTTIILKNRAGHSYTRELKIKSFINELSSSPEENINFPETEMILGEREAPLTIRVFSDFLCSACYKFYKTEEYLLTRFKGRIKIAYYHFPLDRECNINVDDTIYRNSCIAAASMEAAVKNGIFDLYHRLHFDNYPEYKKGYSLKTAVKNLVLLKNRLKHPEVSIRDFSRAIKSPETSALIKKDTGFAGDIKINATPTLFINGKRLVGVPPKELLEAAIRFELKRKNDQNLK